MLVFLHNSGYGIEVGRHHNCLRPVALQFEFCGLLSIYKGFMPLPNRRITKHFLPKCLLYNTFVSLGIFFKHTQNLIAQCYSPDTSIFHEYSVTHCLAIHECSVSYASFFFILHVYYCIHLLLHSRAFYQLRKSVSLFPHPQSYAIGVRQYAFG